MGEVLDEKDIIRWLQSYKGYLQGLLGHSIHLYFSKGEICWVKKEGATTFENILVDKSSGGLPLLVDQYRSGIIVKMIDNWLRELDSVEREAIFWRYINHDFERPKSYFEEMRHCEMGQMLYKTLSYKKISETLGYSVYQTCFEAINKIIKKAVK